MREAWEQTEKTSLSKSDVKWINVEMQLPLAKHLNEDELISWLEDEQLDSIRRFDPAALALAWVRRTRSGHKVNVSALKIGNIRLLNLPGEACIEYQLAAQKMNPNDHVCTAAYEEYGPVYICTEIAYSQGGYESSKSSSFVAPEVESVLLTAISQVLE